MVSKLSTCMVLIFSCSVWAQDVNHDKTGKATIERVKGLRVSSLDRELPEVTLEFFLNYEAGGAPVQWEVSDCPSRMEDSTAPESEGGICVEAHLELKDSRSATVVVLTGNAKSRPVVVPKILSVTVNDRYGAIHDVQRLHDLPMELHRPLPKGPRDLPLPAGAV